MLSNSFLSVYKPIIESIFRETIIEFTSFIILLRRKLHYNANCIAIPEKINSCICLVQCFPTFFQPLHTFWSHSPDGTLHLWHLFYIQDLMYNACMYYTRPLYTVIQ